MEEAPTLRLPNMHLIPATLRSYGIATIYVMQDKIQNDMLYGDKASKAILSNLSYQFFGKVNDPDTAKYYERFFEIIKDPTKSVSRGHNLQFDTRITEGEKEIPKVRANQFFRLQPGSLLRMPMAWIEKSILSRRISHGNFLKPPIGLPKRIYKRILNGFSERFGACLHRIGLMQKFNSRRLDDFEVCF